MSQLSPRELEVLRSIAGGAGVKVTARDAGISPHTVKDYLRVVRLKLGANTTLQAALIAQREGML